CSDCLAGRGSSAANLDPQRRPDLSGRWSPRERYGKRDTTHGPARSTRVVGMEQVSGPRKPAVRWRWGQASVARCFPIASVVGKRGGGNSSDSEHVLKRV